MQYADDDDDGFCDEMRWILWWETIFGSDTAACIACLDKLWKQQIIDQHVYDQNLMQETMRKLTWEGLQQNIVIDGDTMNRKNR